MFTLALLDIDIASVYSKYIQPTIILMWLSSQNSTSHFVYTCVAFFHSTILSTHIFVTISIDGNSSHYGSV